jgi:hypothetical protein
MRIIEPPPKYIPQPIEIMQVIINPIPEKVLRIDSKYHKNLWQTKEHQSQPAEKSYQRTKLYHEQLLL